MKRYHYVIVLFLIVSLFLSCNTKKKKDQEEQTLYYINPVSNITGIGDPDILNYEGMYYMYCTSSGIKGFYVWTSKDMVNWTKEGIAFSRDNPENNFGVDLFWGPDVVYYKGKFYMTYSVRATDKVIYLCLAVSDNPLGPFINLKAPWYDHKLAHIDATIFVEGNKQYCFFVRDCSTNIINKRHTSQIYMVELSDDLSTFITEPELVLTPDEAWEDVNGTYLWMEGPAILKHDGKYYMTYSANGYYTHAYCIGYATADKPSGPWVKAPENPILKADLSIGVSGPGHNSFAFSPDGSELFTIYHSHTYPEKPSGDRTVNIDRVIFKNGKMVIIGPTRTPQPYPSASKRVPYGTKSSKTIIQNSKINYLPR